MISISIDELQPVLVTYWLKDVFITDDMKS